MFVVRSAIVRVCDMFVVRSWFIVHRCGSLMFEVHSFMRYRVCADLIVRGSSLFVNVRCEN